MDRKTTIKVLRDITRKLQDDYLFPDDSFMEELNNGYLVKSKVERYIKSRLESL